MKGMLPAGEGRVNCMLTIGWNRDREGACGSVGKWPDQYTSTDVPSRFLQTVGTREAGIDVDGKAGPAAAQTQAAAIVFRKVVSPGRSGPRRR